MSKTLVIAEIGVNHNGDVGLAREMIAAAKNSGADVVKFQTYKAEEVMTDRTPLAGYMKGGEKNFLELARGLQLGFDETLALKACAEQLGIEFSSSPFDVPSCEFLGTIGLRRLKIPSGETVNPYLLKAAAKTRLPLIISSGMATLDELRWSMRLLNGQGSGPVTILHCTTQYPAEPSFCNLRAMATIAREFDVPVGYSDHTPGIAISLAAVALGASVIEKHFTLDKTLPGPDQAASLEPSEFTDLVRGIRSITSALGNGEKKPFPIELEIAKVARKSLVAARHLQAGTVLQESDLTAKRPGTGIPAMELERVLGRTLRADLRPDDQLAWANLQ
jgi:N-acetylneuraminate synthase/N,N'-diacetyllegionaminate synthase